MSSETLAEPSYIRSATRDRKERRCLRASTIPRRTSVRSAGGRQTATDAQEE